MTTIAFCGRYLAADTMGIRSGNRSEHVGCKIDARDGYAFATGGYWGHYREQLIAWAMCGNGEACPGAGVEGAMLMITPQRELFVFTHEVPFPDPEAAPFALGTGGDIALGAMGAGKTAMEAVQIAARWDIMTGGPIDFIDLERPEKGVQRWDGAEVEERRLVRCTNGMPLREVVAMDTSRDLTNWQSDASTGKLISPIDATMGAGILVSARLRELAECAGTRGKHEMEPRPLLDLAELADILAGLPQRDGAAHAHEYFEVRAHGENYGKCLLNFRRSLRGHLAGQQGALVWRNRPEMGRDTDGVWRAYCRFAVVPSIVEDTDEEGNSRVSLAHELVHTQHAGSVIGRSDICEHGYVRSTCSRCVAQAVAKVRDAQANGHA